MGCSRPGGRTVVQRAGREGGAAGRGAEHARVHVRSPTGDQWRDLGPFLFQPLGSAVAANAGQARALAAPGRTCRSPRLPSPAEGHGARPRWLAGPAAGGGGKWAGFDSKLARQRKRVIPLPRFPQRLAAARSATEGRFIWNPRWSGQSHGARGRQAGAARRGAVPLRPQNGVACRELLSAAVRRQASSPGPGPEAAGSPAARGPTSTCSPCTRGLRGWT